MPQLVVGCLISFAREHPPALCTCTMAIQQGRGLVFIGLCPQRGIIRHLLPRGVVARVLGVRDLVRPQVGDVGDAAAASQVAAFYTNTTCMVCTFFHIFANSRRHHDAST